MGSKQNGNAPASLVRRLGRWARGDRYMVGAYPPEWQERTASDDRVATGHRTASDAPVVPAQRPAAGVLAVAATGG